MYKLNCIYRVVFCLLFYYCISHVRCALLYGLFVMCKSIPLLALLALSCSCTVMHGAPLALLLYSAPLCVFVVSPLLYCSFSIYQSVFCISESVTIVAVVVVVIVVRSLCSIIFETLLCDKIR